MLSEQIKDKLKANWGEKASALDCVAEIKIIGADRDQWACFIFAMNPDDETEVETVTRDFQDYEIMVWNTKDLFRLFSRDGEYVYQDLEYKPRNVKSIIKEPWKY